MKKWYFDEIWGSGFPDLSQNKPRNSEDFFGGGGFFHMNAVKWNSHGRCCIASRFQLAPTTLTYLMSFISFYRIITFFTYNTFFCYVTCWYTFCNRKIKGFYTTKWCTFFKALNQACLFFFYHLVDSYCN